MEKFDAERAEAESIPVLQTIGQDERTSGGRGLDREMSWNQETWAVSPSNGPSDATGWEPGIATALK